MDEKLEKVSFVDPIDGETVEFYVLEQTTLAGVNYLLVTDEEDGDCECYVMKETAEADGEVTYDMVEDEKEARTVAKLFAEMLDDVEIE